MTANVPTPKELYDGVYAGLLAERKRLHDAELVVKESRDRIKKAEKMLRMFEGAFSLKPEGVSVVVSTPKSKAEGIAVVDGFPCTCGRVFSTKYGLGTHRWKAGHDVVLTQEDASR